MVNCPTCGWPMAKRREWESGGFVFGKYYCDSLLKCPTTLKVKAPTDWMVGKGKWEQKSEC